MSKSPLFTPAERMAMVGREVAAMGIANVEVVGFNALLMKFAQKEGANVIVRGLRAVADFEYEYQMAGMNQQLNPSRSEEHTSELQSLMRISYAVFCLKKKT